MNKSGKNLIIAGIVIAITTIIIGLVVFFNQKPLDISGEYILKIDGKFNGTHLTVTDMGREFAFLFKTSSGLSGSYTSKKMLSGTYTLIDFSGNNKVSEYRLIASPEALHGTIDVLPIGKVEVLFEKQHNGNSKT